MKSISTLIELAQRRAALQPMGCAYKFLTNGEREEDSITYDDLDARARAIAAWLQQRTRVGDRALLLFPPGIDYITAFFGCLFAGVIAVPAYPPRQKANRGAGRMEAIVRDAQPSAILAGPTVSSENLEGIPALWQCAADIPSGLARQWREPDVRENSIAFLQYTSGSTALPRGVMLSHANLIHNQRMIQEACGHDANSTFAGWLPLYHDMGLIGNVLQPLFLGAACILMAPSAFVQKPARWLRAIAKYRAHTSGGPNFAYDLCVRKIGAEEREGLDLTSWKVAFNGAEPVRQETLDAFTAKFGPQGFHAQAFTPCYGLAEASLIVSCRRRNASASLQAPGSGDAERTVVSCGPAVIDTEIAIVDPDSREASPAGGSGEIWVRGASVAQGYWNRPLETEQVFGARLRGGASPNGAAPNGEPADGAPAAYLRTGDLGFLQGGELFITGRIKDLIIIRGANHHAEDIEWSAQQCSPAVTAAAAFSIDQDGEESLILAVELDRSAGCDPAALSARIRQTIAERHEVELRGLVAARPGRIPRTSSGKIQRRLCRRQFLDGELEIAARLIPAESGAPGSETLSSAAPLAAIAAG